MRPDARRRRRTLAPTPAVAATTLLLAGGLPLLPAPASALQDSNVLLPIPEIEERLTEGDFRVAGAQPARGLEDERTVRAMLMYEDGTSILAQLAPAPAGGEAFNNVPQYDLAAYRIQELFLDEDEYVVPPTVVRAFPVEWCRQHVKEDVPATFRDTESALVVVQYWVWNVQPEGIWDEDRFESDTAYARHVANFDIFTHLIRHNDSNLGNYLISTDSTSPRVFSIDNGVAFDAQESDRGFKWRGIRVERLPRKTVERLRELTLEELQEALGVLAQFELQPGGQFARVAPTDNLDPGDGIRRSSTVIQIGLEDDEIEDIHERIQDLLEEVDEGEYELF